MTTLPNSSTKMQAMDVPLANPDIDRLKQEFDVAEFEARVFFFKRAVGFYLDEWMPSDYLVRSIEGLFPTISRAMIERLVAKLVTDKARLNGSRDQYIDKMWTKFSTKGKLTAQN